MGGKTDGDIGALQTLVTLAGLGYMVGGLLFGIALFRARIPARWTAARSFGRRLRPRRICPPPARARSACG